MAEYGGEGGIRTLGTLARSTVFETAPFDHSGTSPRGAGVLAEARVKIKSEAPQTGQHESDNCQ